MDTPASNDFNSDPLPNASTALLDRLLASAPLAALLAASLPSFAAQWPPPSPSPAAAAASTAAASAAAAASEGTPVCALPLGGAHALLPAVVTAALAAEDLLSALESPPGGVGPKL